MPEAAGTAASTSEEHWEKTIDLLTGCKVSVDESHSVVELPVPKIRGDCDLNETAATESSDDASKRRQWKAISSAIWKGGLRSFDDSSDETKDDSKSETVRVMNYKVPCTYDGLNPEPKALLRNAIQDEFASSTAENTTIGIMTAASMKSLRTATRSAGGIVIDVIVTAGISNARAAGASADFFGILPDIKNSDSDTEEKSNNSKSEPSPQPIPPPSESPNDGLRQRQEPPPGTINTVVVINGAALTQAAMIEAYAIAVEAKCGACSDHSVMCANDAQRIAQGTGTDCCVLLCPSEESPLCVSYAGKHCLLAELIGQAVWEATSEAILSNLHHFYGESIWKHYAYRYLASVRGILEGARPCVPPKPMDPVPRAPISVLVLGWAMVGISYLLYHNVGILPRSAAILLAAAAWDRCFPEPPLSLHPVVLAGTTISLATKQWIPESVFAMDRPFVGFFAGLCFLIGTLGIFVSGAYVFVSSCRWAEEAAIVVPIFFLNRMLAFAFWVLEVALFKTTFSLQLLCTIALQMARFLERSQLKEARAQLSWLCSRDPTHLNSEELAGGTLESLAVSAAICECISQLLRVFSWIFSHSFSSSRFVHP